MITPIGAADRRRSLVRGTVIDSLLIAGTVAVATLIAGTVFTQQADPILKGGLAVGGMLIALRMLRGLTSHLFDSDDIGVRRRRRQRTERTAPAELFDMEGRISLARVSAFDYQSRMRPVIRELAAQRLEMNRHIDLERQPEAARNVLDPELWNEVQPATWVSGDLRDAPGPSLAMLGRMADGLEAI